MRTTFVDEKVLIVGAGCFGLSTAYHLLKEGYKDVTVIDRSEPIPALDGSSNDINRIVRTSYADPFYSNLAHAAIQSWKKTELWGDTYHDSGVLVLGSTEYVATAYQNDADMKIAVEFLKSPADFRSKFPADIQLGQYNDGQASYFNRDSGWANAQQGIERIVELVKNLGGKILPGHAAKKLTRQDGRTTGVECANGVVLDASLIILATGAWTASTFSELNLQDKLTATGQSVGMIQLSPQEADLYRDCPVVLNFTNGFYCFPPNKDNILKVAIHSQGYTNNVDGVSTPRTIVSHPKDGLSIPRSVLDTMKVSLREVYPKLADRAFTGTRLCWYTDTDDDHWIIGPVPGDVNLVLATAGCGHAYKFLPVIGSLTAQLLLGTLEPDLAAKFAVDRLFSLTKDRVGQKADLSSEVLCT